MDANYVMDETLGTAKYSLSKLKVGQTEHVTLSIGKVNVFCFFYTMNLHKLNS